MNEEHRFEIDVTVRGAGKDNEASLHREYKSVDAASAYKALGEVWDAVSNEAKAKMTPVSSND